MANKINYQKELDKLIEINQQNNIVPNLLLHACCAPCSSYCLEYLSEYFKITVLFYNPNISQADEYELRANELKRLIREMQFTHKVDYIDAQYKPEEFYDIAKGYEQCIEGGERCFRCYRQRLEKTARIAVSSNTEYNYFCTTLSISPLKNAEKINLIGYELGLKYGIKWLPSDFKKKNGYLRSIQLSNEYSLYRQNFCGCVYSKKNI